MCGSLPKPSTETINLSAELRTLHCLADVFLYSGSVNHLNQQNSRSNRGFSLFEVILATGVFAIAAVSLAGALNSIALTATEANETSLVREQIRSLLIESTRAARISEGVQKTPTDRTFVSYRIETNRVDLLTREGNTLPDLFEVTVTAFREIPGKEPVEISRASTLTNPAVF